MVTMTATARNALKQYLFWNVGKVFFQKQNGEMREMDCTLIPEYMDAPSEENSTKTRVPNPDILSVWDLGKKNWRSFRYDSVERVVFPDRGVDITYER
jgi:hypothetical protein